MAATAAARVLWRRDGSTALRDAARPAPFCVTGIDPAATRPSHTRRGCPGTVGGPWCHRGVTVGGSTPRRRARRRSTGWCAGDRARTVAARGSTRRSRPSSTTPAGRCWCSPAPAPGKTTTIVEAVAARIERGRRPRADPRPDLQPQGRRRAAHPHHRAGSAAPSASRWPAPSTPTPTASCAAPRCCAATPRRGCSPPPSRTPSSPSCCAATPRRRAPSAGRPSWPRRWAPRASARELRELLLRATERGVDARAARRLGPRARAASTGCTPPRSRSSTRRVTAFSTAGRGDASGYDPAELVRQAIAELDGDPELLRQERERARWLFVDEYQDTDPAQVELLELLAGGGGNLVAVGDPDQAIYAFRGAEPRGIVEFPDRFRHTDGRPAGRVSLGVCRRSGAELLRISRRVAEGLPGPWEHRRLAPVEGTDPRRGRGARVRLGRGRGGLPRRRPPPGAPARRRALVADGGRRPHRRRARAAAPGAGLGRRAGRGLRRRPAAGRAAGRRAVAAARSPRCCRRPAAGGEPAGLDEPAAEALLASPLGGATVLDLRRLRRAVRIALARQRRSTPPSAASRWPPRWPTRRCSASLPEHVARPARRVAGVLDAGRVALAAGRHRRGRAVGHVAAQRAGRPLGPGQRRAAARRARSPTATSTPSSRCSTPPPASSTGCRRPTSARSSPTCPPRSCPATPARPARWQARRSGC